MKIMVYIFIILGVFIVGAQTLVAEYDKEVTFHVIDEEEQQDYLSNVSITMIPKLPVRMEEKLAGPGGYVFSTDKYKLAYLTFKKEGYKTKRMIKFIQADETYPIYLTKRDDFIDPDEESGTPEKND